mgnify:CR=1 FL=1
MGTFENHGRPDYTGYITLNDEVAEDNIDFLLLVLQQLGRKAGISKLPRSVSIDDHDQENGRRQIGEGSEKKKIEKKLENTAKRGGSIKLGELVLFSRQLATMIDAGIPLVQTLEILSEQVEHKGFKAIVETTQFPG